MAKITVDGVEYEVQDGRTVLQALDDLGVLMNGVDVPHYCWHPKLSIDGSCRLCQVEIEGFPKLQIACNTPVKDGMVVRTRHRARAPRARGRDGAPARQPPARLPDLRQGGRVQAPGLRVRVRRRRTRAPASRAARCKKKADLGPTIVLDQERCILCRRCVRFCREVPGTGELAVFARGDHSVLDIHEGHPLDNDYSMNVADICPVGALTTKDFRFKIRVWFLDDAPGVCTGCSNGCNVHLGRREQQGLPLRAAPERRGERHLDLRRGAALATSAIGAPDRLTEVSLRGRARPRSGAPERRRRRGGRAAAAARSTPTAAAAVAGVASAHACNEDLYVLRRLLAGPRRAGRRARADGSRRRSAHQGREGRQRRRRAGPRLRRPRAARRAHPRGRRARPRRARARPRRLPGLLGGAGRLAGLDAVDPPRHPPLRSSSAPPTSSSRRATPPSARVRSRTTPAACSA